MRELVRVARDLDFEDTPAFEHFCGAIANVGRIVDKAVAKKTGKASSSKGKSPVPRLVVDDSDDDDDDNDNDNDDDPSFRLRLARSNERMATAYAANAASNNRLAAAMEDANALKRAELLGVAVPIETAADREKAAEKEKQYI